MQKGIGIVMGGPPNSGKSTFSLRLTRALEDQGIDVHKEDFDIWSPTIEYLEGKITAEEREAKKRKDITEKDAQKAAKLFEKLLNAHSLVIGDGPGKISNESEIILKNAQYGIIICRDDKQEEIKIWKEFFEKIGITVIGIVISKTNGSEKITLNSLIEAEFTDLSRENTQVTSNTRAFASLLRSKLGI